MVEYWLPWTIISFPRRVRSFLAVPGLFDHAARQAKSVTLSLGAKCSYHRSSQSDQGALETAGYNPLQLGQPAVSSTCQQQSLWDAPDRPPRKSAGRPTKYGKHLGMTTALAKANRDRAE